MLAAAASYSSVFVFVAKTKLIKVFFLIVCPGSETIQCAYACMVVPYLLATSYIYRGDRS